MDTFKNVMMRILAVIAAEALGVIGAGSLVLDRILLACGAKEFVASESDILDGMAWSLV